MATKVKVIGNYVFSCSCAVIGALRLDSSYGADGGCILNVKTSTEKELEKVSLEQFTFFFSVKKFCVKIFMFKYFRTDRTSQKIF